MSWTKGQIIKKAFNSIGLSEFVFDLTPEMLNDALATLDSMMAEWATTKGLRLGYSAPSDIENSKLQDESNLPDWANNAVFNNLAIQIAPAFGKQVSQQTAVRAKQGYDAIVSWCMSNSMQEQQLSGSMPRGAGAKNWNRPYIAPPINSVLTGQEGPLELF